jgi:hypothetical protein
MTGDNHTDPSNAGRTVIDLAPPHQQWRCAQLLALTALREAPDTETGEMLPIRGSVYRVATVLALDDNLTRRSDPSQVALAHSTGLTLSSVNHAIGTLRRIGWLDVTHGRRNGGEKYGNGATYTVLDFAKVTR